MVTPCVGVWIETEINMETGKTECVTPCVGVWIETPAYRHDTKAALSHPAWVCGLKLEQM